ncbi:MAG: radical SAM protein [Methanomassiliicoccales archaeon]|nr:radical SAM protein [Methanomassiliicoccales archaeon]
MEPLRRYWSILKGIESPAYFTAKARRIDFSAKMRDKELWKVHDRAIVSSIEGEGKGDLLSLKMLLAERMLSDCELCENRCGVDRSKGEKGECGVGPAKIASMFLHHGEEAPLVPSFTVFFSGCNFECAFCQNFDISTDPDAGREVPPESLARRIENLTDIGRAGFHVSLVREWDEKARNVNWVGGEPTPNIEFVLRVLKECRANIPQVWNSNMYMSERCMALLDGVVDVYLSDFKYGNDECAKRLSDVDDYFKIVSRNHLLAAKNADMIVRHLMLPGHFECCTKTVLEWLAENLPGALVNVMDQYRPMHRAESFPELRGPVPRKDYEAAVALARKLKLSLV